MALRLIQAPTNPLTLAEVKTHLRITHDHEDALLTLYMGAALSAIDVPHGILGRPVSTQTWELLLDEFPAGPIEIPMSPLQTILSVTYYDENGNLQPLPVDAYAVDAVSDPGWIVPAGNWPETFPTTNAVVIRFVSGFAPVPDALKAWMLLRIASLYENRSEQSDKPLMQNTASELLLWPFRVVLP